MSQLGPALLLGINYACFAWAVGGHFTCSGPASPRLVLVTAIATISVVVSLTCMFTHPARSAWLIGASMLFMSVGGALFWWAVASTRLSRLPVLGDDALPARLVRDGAFRVVPHPFYTAYAITWVGAAMASAHWVPWAPVAIVSALYLDSAMREGRMVRRLARSECAAPSTGAIHED